jgi:hypothetical protein
MTPPDLAHRRQCLIDRARMLATSARRVGAIAPHRPLVAAYLDAMAAQYEAASLAEVRAHADPDTALLDFLEQALEGTPHAC